MRSSRTPEHRSGSSRLVLLLGLFILVVGLGLAITYFTQGFGSLSAETTEPVPAVTETEDLVEPEVVSEPSAPASRKPAPRLVSRKAPPTSLPRTRRLSPPLLRSQ